MGFCAQVVTKVKGDSDMTNAQHFATGDITFDEPYEVA